MNWGKMIIAKLADIVESNNRLWCERQKNILLTPNPLNNAVSNGWFLADYNASNIHS